MKKGILPTLKRMEINDTEVFPVDRLNVLKTTASLVGAQLQRGYSTSLVRAKNIVLVTRNK